MRTLLMTVCLLAWATAWGADPESLSGTVLAYADGDGYTYLQVSVGKDTAWVFGPKAEAHLRQRITFPTDGRKSRHKSKDLDRVFQGIYYVEDLAKALVDEPKGEPESAKTEPQGVTEEPAPVKGVPPGHPAVKARMAPGAQLPAGHPKINGNATEPGMMAPGAQLPAGHPKVSGNATEAGMKAPGAQLPAGHPKVGGGGGMGMPGKGIDTPPGAPQAAAQPAAPIEVAEAKGGYTVAGIFTKRKDLAGQEVLVRGQVVKVNRNIMRRNWIHIQDGTGEAGTNDLTVTTDQDVPDVGTIVLVRGELALDRDFGYGYKYEVIVEKGQVAVEK